MDTWDPLGCDRTRLYKNEGNFPRLLAFSVAADRDRWAQSNDVLWSLLHQKRDWTRALFWARRSVGFGSGFARFRTGTGTFSSAGELVIRHDFFSSPYFRWLKMGVSTHGNASWIAPSCPTVRGASWFYALNNLVKVTLFQSKGTADEPPILTDDSYPTIFPSSLELERNRNCPWFHFVSPNDLPRVWQDLKTAETENIASSSQNSITTRLIRPLTCKLVRAHAPRGQRLPCNQSYWEA